MRLTNNYNLPQPIVDAIRNDTYDKGDSDISVTSLWKPLRATMLEAQHEDELESDAADEIWALLGKLMHELLDRAGGDDIREKRLYITRHGIKVGGKFDRLVLDSGSLRDYKLTSVWAVINGAKDEWELQLNTYAHILREHHIDVKGLYVDAILRDWSKPEARRSADYPRKAYKEVPVTLWDPDYAEKRISDRIAEFLAVKTAPELPLCTDEERWAGPEKWAVKKRGAKAAVKGGVHESKLIAERHAAELGSAYYVEHRPSQPKRCLDYCAAAPFCAQWSEDPRNNARQHEAFVEGLS